MRNPLCPDCGEAGRLVDLPKDNIQFYWCGECFVKWPSRDEPAEAPDYVSYAPDDVEPVGRPAHRPG